MDHGLWVRPGARLRVLFRSAPDLAVRRLPLADVIAVFQRGGRTWPVTGSRAHDSGARSPLPVRCEGTNGDDHSIGAGSPHRLALDARSLGSFASIPIPMARTDGGAAGKRHALDDGCGDPGRACLAGV